MRVLLVRGLRDAEGEAAAGWLEGHGFVWRAQEASEVTSQDDAWADVVWWHAGVPPSVDMPSVALRHRVTDVGGVLLSQLACALPAMFGLDDLTPEFITGRFSEEDDPLWDPAFKTWPDFPHIRGMQGWSGGRHPLFEGLVNGTFCRQLHEGDLLVDAGHVWPGWPARARVIAVERAYVRLNSERAVAWEYAVGNRRVLCLGAHVELTGQHHLSAQRDRLLGNALALVARPHPPQATDGVWPTRRGPVAVAPLAPRVIAPPSRRASNDGPILRSAGEPNSPYTLAGRRALVVGTEGAGLDEVWIHPLAVLTGGLRLSVHGVSPTMTSVQVTPVSITRTMQLSREIFVERVTPDLNRGSVLLEYEGDVPEGVVLDFQMPLRLEWPYDADALTPLSAALVGDSKVGFRVTVVGCDAQHVATVTIDGARHVVLEPDPIAPRIVVSGYLGRSLRLLFDAGTGGTEALGVEPAPARNDLVERRESHFQSLRERTVQFQSPDASLDSAVAWAVHRLDMFMAVPPTGGLALMAGFAKSRAGWSISRPGYAWFFGRDACWSADAMLLAGMFQEVRAIIHHLAGTRDVTGKIYHELTTSGACHYDAADATPLFLRLVGRYYAFTGDRDTLHDVWDAVRQSIAFVMSTDRDHDGLPENSDVGHGWVETGPLGGGVVTSYMAALWIDALGELLVLARAMEDDGLVLGLARAREQAVASIDGQLRDRASGRLGLQRNRDGSLATDLTALSAVPIALGVDTHPDSNAILDALTSSAFTTSWGVRMLANTDARYNPTGYHFGAVWPLFTGWTALACFERGRTSEGLALWRTNASLATARAKGAFDEVLHGDTGEAAGVCPDQAWSAAMVVAPALAGIWGIRPSRGGRRLLLRLQIPHAWPRAALTGLKVGTAVLDIRVEQREVADGRQLMVAVHQRSGSLEAIGVELFAAPHQRVWTRSGEMLRVSVVLPGNSGRWCRWDIVAPSTREILHFVIGADS